MPQPKARPSIWIGHITRRVQDVIKSADFFKSLGLRVITNSAQMAILELRGGTHLLLFPNTSRYETIPNDEFDLMVEDIERAQKGLASQGVKVSKLKRDQFHEYFEASDPDGKKWRINSDHTEGRAV